MLLFLLHYNIYECYTVTQLFVFFKLLCLVQKPRFNSQSPSQKRNKSTCMAIKLVQLVQLKEMTWHLAGDGIRQTKCGL